MALDGSLKFGKIAVAWTLWVPKNGQHICSAAIKIINPLVTFARFTQLFPYCHNIQESISLDFTSSATKI